MTLAVTEIANNVFHIEAASQYEIASTFMRVQEFYESPYSEIRRTFFTHEQYMDIDAHGTARSADEAIIFGYFETWSGFNIPGDVFNQWVNIFSPRGLWQKEQQLVDSIYEHLKDRTDQFYVIGTSAEEANVIDHELSHAWFYLDPKYKTKMLKLVKQLSKKHVKQLCEHLAEEGYTPSVFDDEIVAYLSTSPMVEVAMMFPGDVPWPIVYKFQKAFQKTRDKKID